MALCGHCHPNKKLPKDSFYRVFSVYSVILTKAAKVFGGRGIYEMTGLGHAFGYKKNGGACFRIYNRILRGKRGRKKHIFDFSNSLPVWA
jgi:hypothetical protein